MSAEMQITAWARTLIQQLSYEQLVPPGVERLPINRRTTFYAYRDMGRERSLLALARALRNPPWDGKVSIEKLREWSRAEGWPCACAAWDAEQARTDSFDELESLESQSRQIDALLFSVFDEDDLPQIDTKALSVLFDVRLGIAERILVLRTKNAAEAQSMNAGRRNLQGVSESSLVPSDVCDSQDRPLVLDQAVEGRRDGDGAADSKPRDNDLHDSASDEGEATDDACEEEEVEYDDDCDDEFGLAELVGCTLKELPEKYKQKIRPGDGRIRRILVSKRDGFIVLMVNTDKPAWITVETGVRCS